MGSFEVESRFPARLGARMAQCFTSTEPSIVLFPDQLSIIPDVETNGSVHTDGVGTISPGLARMIWDSLQRDGKAGKTRRRDVPSAFQIRLGGMKGMVVVDQRLIGIQVRLLCFLLRDLASANLLTLSIVSAERSPKYGEVRCA
jgi:RNA-dependent RNA polymerase